MGRKRRTKRERRRLSAAPPGRRWRSPTWNQFATTVTALLLVLTPFIFDPRLVNPSSNDRYEIPRDTFFLLGCLLLATLGIIRAIWRQAWREVLPFTREWPHSPFLCTLWEGSLVVFLVLALTSLAFTTMLPLSLVALQSLFLSALFYATLSRSLSPPSLILLLRINVLTAGAVGLHCLLQYYGIEPLIWFGGTLDPRFTGVGTGYIGNTSHTGVYLAGAVPLGVALAWASPSPFWRVLLAGGTLFATAGLFATGSRGGATGLLCGLVSLVILRGITLARQEIVSRWRTISVGTLALLLAAWLASPWIQTSPVWRRMSTSWERITKGEWEAGIGTRPYNWRVAWMMVREHPLTGTGIGTFAQNLARYKVRLDDARDPTGEMYQHAHNEFLQVWAEMGTPALLVALPGVLSLLAWGVSISWRKEHLPERWVAIGLTASLTTILLSSLVDFIFHLSVTALPALLCAAGLRICDQRTDAQAPASKAEQTPFFHLRTEGLPAPLRSRWPRLTLSCSVAVLAFVFAHQTLRPLWGLYAENRGDLLLYLAEQHRVPENKLPLLFAQAERVYRQAVDIYPHSVTAYLSLGYTQLRQRRYEEGIANLHKALEYLEAGEIYSLLGEAYFEIGNIKAAEEAFEKSVKIRYTDDAQRWLERVRAITAQAR